MVAVEELRARSEVAPTEVVGISVLVVAQVKLVGTNLTSLLVDRVEETVASFLRHRLAGRQSIS
jgi:hypothetical protein